MVKGASRRYAKRQLTFFRAIPEVRWFDAREPETAREALGVFLGLACPPLDLGPSNRHSQPCIKGDRTGALRTKTEKT